MPSMSGQSSSPSLFFGKFYEIQRWAEALGTLGTIAVGCFAWFFLILYGFLRMSSTHGPNLKRDESEKQFLDPSTKKHHPFPSINDPPSIDLSLVVPAYKEESRLPKMMKETMKYLTDRQEKNSNFTYEVLIVNDGSTDNTSQEALKFVSEYGTERVRLLEFTRNRGKGGAIRIGCLSARGRRILMVDADGATLISDIEKLEEAMDKLVGDSNQAAVVVGSRAHLQEDAVAKRSFFRNILMYGFHFLAIMCVHGVKDTQCGFKLFTRAAAQTLFTQVHIDRWAFDVELLYIAEHLRMPIAEVAVNWQEIEGSKLVPVFSWMQMGRDLLFIKLRYMLGVWNVVEPARDPQKPKTE